MRLQDTSPITSHSCFLFILRIAMPLLAWMLLPAHGSPRRTFLRQRLEAGNHVEQFLVDAALAQTVKGAVERLQQVIDVFVGALHRRQTARILARERFGTRPE